MWGPPGLVNLVLCGRASDRSRGISCSKVTLNKTIALFMKRIKNCVDKQGSQIDADE